jgi:heterogeneous nuclear ribonucleoprotein A1/A3
MGPTKKRKLDENGVVPPLHRCGPRAPKTHPGRRPQIVDRIDKEKLPDIVAVTAASHVDVLDGVRALVNSNSLQRKLFIRDLSWDTTTNCLRALFSSYGELEKAVAILDKQTDKSKGYGFATFNHVDDALLALKEPSKLIDAGLARV